MHEWDENRLLHINLETRAEIAEYVEILPDDSAAARERYGELKLTGDAIAQVPQIIELNKKMLTMDGSLATVAILMQGDRTIDTLMLDFYDQASKRIAIRRLADWVEHSNADGLIFISESWIGFMKPGEDPADPRTPPARNRPDRMEAIQVVAITRDGRASNSTCIFTREEDGTILFGETMQSSDAQLNALEPVRRRWREKANPGT
jgi:hypothetical protein